MQGLHRWKYSKEGSSHCTFCESGKASNNQSSGWDLPKGRISSIGDENCTDCKAGSSLQQYRRTSARHVRANTRRVASTYGGRECELVVPSRRCVDALPFLPIRALHEIEAWNCTMCEAGKYALATSATAQTATMAPTQMPGRVLQRVRAWILLNRGSSFLLHQVWHQ